MVEVCKKEVEKARMEGRLPILVGGTGLYLNAASMDFGDSRGLRADS